jgi:hypothetical protein
MNQALLRGVSDEAIPDWQSGYAESISYYSLCIIWDCFVARLTLAASRLAMTGNLFLQPNFP